MSERGDPLVRSFWRRMRIGFRFKASAAVVATAGIAVALMLALTLALPGPLPLLRTAPSPGDPAVFWAVAYCVDEIEVDHTNERWLRCSYAGYHGRLEPGSGTLAPVMANSALPPGLSLDFVVPAGEALAALEHGRSLLRLAETGPEPAEGTILLVVCREVPLGTGQVGGREARQAPGRLLPVDPRTLLVDREGTARRRQQVKEILDRLSPAAPTPGPAP